MIDSTICELLPVRPDSVEGESTHSWVHRLAEANGFQTAVALLDSIGAVVDRTADLDLIFEEGFFETLARKMGYHHPDGARCTSLACLEGSLVPEFLRRTYHRWILSRGSMGRAYGSAAPYMVCPFCIQNGDPPFWRMSWRLSLVTTCEIHKTGLWDRCPECDEPFVLRSNKPADLTCCQACKSPIKPRKADHNKEHRTWLTELVERLGKLERDDLPVDVAQEYQFWEGVSFLVGIITNRKHTAKLLLCELPPYIRNILRRLEKSDRKDFNAMGVLDRRDVLRVIAWLLENWPSRLVNTFGEAGILSSATLGFDYEPVYWVHRVFREHLAHKRYSADATEIENAIRSLNAYGIRVSKKRVRMVLGIAESKVLDRRFPKRVRFTHTYLKRLFAHLAKEIIESPPGRDERFCAIRDAVAISVCVLTGLHPDKVIQLSVVSAYDKINEALLRKTKTSEALEPYLVDWLHEYEEGTKERNCRGSDDAQFLVGRYGPAQRLHGVFTRFTRALRCSGYRYFSHGIRVLQDLSHPEAAAQ